MPGSTALRIVKLPHSICRLGTKSWHRNLNSSYSPDIRRRVPTGTASSRFRYLLLAMPVTAFFLGTWQVQRRRQKLELIEDMESKLQEAPLTSMSEIIAIMGTSNSAGDSLPVRLCGAFEHDKEMLVGPRQHEGQTGFHVITPFVVQNTRILVNRGWISKSLAVTTLRRRTMTANNHVINGLIRRKTASNYFTPENLYEKNEFYFVDIGEMSKRTDSCEIFVEATRDASFSTDEFETNGVPIGRPHEVLLRNNHMQYIFTW